MSQGTPALQTVDPAKESWGSPVAAPTRSQREFKRQAKTERERRRYLETERSRTERKLEAQLLEELWEDWKNP